MLGFGVIEEGTAPVSIEEVGGGGDQRWVVAQWCGDAAGALPLLRAVEWQRAGMEGWSYQGETGPEKADSGEEESGGHVLALTSDPSRVRPTP
jgi:hypothetical protein